jgi:hypothetical protein
MQIIHMLWKGVNLDCHNYMLAEKLTQWYQYHHPLLNALWTGDSDLRLYITTVQDGRRKSASLNRAWFPRTMHLITQKLLPNLL